MKEQEEYRMKAEELRIGVWVFYESTIDDHEPKQVNGSDIALFKEWADRYAPISIAEEWVKKLGYEIEYRAHSTSNYDWIAEKGNIKIVSLGDDVSVSLRFGGGRVLLENIRFVHQLQNLYYVLTN